MATKPSFIALMNKTGIACAASDDFTIYKLSSKEPLAIAVNPRSRIPWETIIYEYKLKGEPGRQETLVGYAESFWEAFEEFLSKGIVTYDKRWEKADENDCRILFLGYGCNDVYPSSLTLKFTFTDGDVEPEVIEDEMVVISSKQETAKRMIGDFNLLAPLFKGISSDVISSFMKLLRQQYPDFKKRRIAVESLNARYSHVLEEKEQEINKGLRSFSMTDLVLSAETILNANVRLAWLKSGNRPPAECVREIAVITRPEGIKWVKHSYIFE